MKYLLDTNIISELISNQPNQSVLDFLSLINENDIYLSVITIGEIKSGIENVKSLDKKEKLSKWLEDELLKRFENRIINIDINAMMTWVLSKYTLFLTQTTRPIVFLFPNNPTKLDNCVAGISPTIFHHK